MDRENIMADIEKLQEKTDEKGFIGINEYDLYLRELIADYVAKLFVIGVVSNNEVAVCNKVKCGGYNTLFNRCKYLDGYCPLEAN